jgi:arylsulfatase A-like enzyme
MVRWPGHVQPGTKSDDILGGLDLMATFASVAEDPTALDPDKLDTLEVMETIKEGQTIYTASQ